MTNPALPANHVPSIKEDRKLLPDAQDRTRSIHTIQLLNGNQSQSIDYNPVTGIGAKLRPGTLQSSSRRLDVNRQPSLPVPRLMTEFFHKPVHVPFGKFPLEGYKVDPWDHARQPDNINRTFFHQNSLSSLKYHTATSVRYTHTGGRYRIQTRPYEVSNKLQGLP